MESLRELYCEENLKKISRKIIRAYEMKDLGSLNRLASVANINPDDFSGSIGRLFKKLILIFHPDRLTIIHKLIDKYQREGQSENLNKMRTDFKQILMLDLPQTKAVDDHFNSYQEEYTFDPMGHSFDDFTDNQTVRFWESEEWGFIEAVKNMMYGNLFSEFLPKDLYYLEGLLDLPECGISDLQGIEYCQNITGLNLERNELENLSGLDQLTNLKSLYLSHNRIENIDLLSELKGLKTLDISYNNIEDIRVLLSLEELTYLNILGNPLIKKTPALALLQQRCLIIMD